MTDLTRSARFRRSGRRPGWTLLTVLLVLAIAASSALVFTNRVELLKLAVILALWAAVVAAFVSVIYRRQSDIDQAKVRDLKLVYDLQLDREISARREYELSVETQLRRELVAELRAQAADEVAGLRAELAALRANLEMLFDADLSDRPALETDRAGFDSYDDWPGETSRAGRVASSRLDTEDRHDIDAHTDESPIIDVPEEPQTPEFDWPPTTGPAGAHHRASDSEPAEEWRTWSPPGGTTPPPPRPTPAPPPEPEYPWLSPQPPPVRPEPPEPAPEPEPQRQPESEPQHAAWRSAASDWRPAPEDGQWIPPGAPGSNWVSSPETAQETTRETTWEKPFEPATESATESALRSPLSSQRPAADSSGEYVGRRRAPEPPQPSAPYAPEPEPRRGRHAAPSESAARDQLGEQPRTGRRRRSADENTGGQSVAELLARLQATPGGGGRRRRREE